MTLAEFKAWFEGFTEGMESTPSEKQWQRIKERVTALGENAKSGLAQGGLYTGIGLVGRNDYVSSDTLGKNQTRMMA